MKKNLGIFTLLLTLALMAPLQAQEVYYVDLFTDINSGGTKYRIPVYQDEKNLTLIKLNDGTDLDNKVSSIEYNLPQDWEVVLWPHVNFQGNSISIKGQGNIGNLGEIDRRFGLNDKISSVQWRNTRKDNLATLGTQECLLQLFEDQGNKGRRLTVNCNQDIADLRQINSDDGRKNFDNKTSSLIYNLPEGTKVELYQHLNNRAPVVMVLEGSGQVDTIEEFKNDRVSSIKWLR